MSALGHIVFAIAALAPRPGSLQSAHRRVKDVEWFDLRDGPRDLGLRPERDLHATYGLSGLGAKACSHDVFFTQKPHA